MWLLQPSDLFMHTKHSIISGGLILFINAMRTMPDITPADYLDLGWHLIPIQPGKKRPFKVSVDEDGRCVSCGATATGDGADMAAAWRQLAKDLGEFVSTACPDALAWVGDGGLAERLDGMEFWERKDA